MKRKYIVFVSILFVILISGCNAIKTCSPNEVEGTRYGATDLPYKVCYDPLKSAGKICNSTADCIGGEDFTDQGACAVDEEVLRNKCKEVVSGSDTNYNCEDVENLKGICTKQFYGDYKGFVITDDKMVQKGLYWGP